MAAVLRGAAVLLRIGDNWDWFVNLGARDYPLVTQDDLLHVFSFLPRELNFANHSSYIGWRESRRLKPIIVDPGLYLSTRSGMFHATQKRDLPTAYQLFTGSSTAILSRKFVEFCILGSDNLPRLLLMYSANTPSSLLNYFPTVLCNSPQFNMTTINHNLLFASLNKPFKEDPRPLDTNDLECMILSGSAFATQFPSNDPVLDRIDQEVLGRNPGKVVPGGWCLGEGDDRCETWGDADILRPGSAAKRLERLLVELLSNGTYRSQQCVAES
ncbi:Beta-glucuronosyltransferase GlcAT14A-like protein [Drosera capensis]